MIVKHGRFGKFIACSNYPECKYTEPLDTGFKCPRDGCDGRLVEKYSRKGKVFFACSNYPKCDFASWDPPIAGKCPSCGQETMFLVVRKKNTVRKCAHCGYTEPVEEPSHVDE